ncbi:unnamed protein product [Colias eurytheme]|nr:unnamed protein product [Colias eurytheme]
MEVADFYAGKNVFITGATGFIGKVLVEKLLRSTRVERVYIMMRPKKGQGLKMRWNQFIGSRVFDNIRNNPHIFDKLQVIRGDILSEGLGMSAEDRRVLEDCHVVFHCAACVKFNMFIRDAVNMNVVGTQRVLQLAENMNNLLAFIHLSTTYCRSDVSILDEQLYPSKHSPRDVIHTVTWMEYDLLKHLEDKLIHPQPNTYGYTKSLAEQLVSEYEGKFPIAIARPSIVTASVREPFPGWVDNLNGPTGVIVGAAKGVIRSMLCADTQHVDAMPVDLVVNGVVLVACSTALQRPKDIVVYNLARSNENPITWRESIELARSQVSSYPFSVPLWFPGGSTKTSPTHHAVAVLLTHTIPAYLVDCCLVLMGKKPFLVNVHKRINEGMKVLQYYSTKSWNFNNQRFMSLKNNISKEEDNIFYTDPKEMHWPSYIRNYLKGSREFCCGELPETLPQARILHNRLYYLDLFVKMVLMFSLAYFVCVLSIKVYNTL